MAWIDSVPIKSTYITIDFVFVGKISQYHGRHDIVCECHDFPTSPVPLCHRAFLLRNFRIVALQMETTVDADKRWS